MEKLSTTVPSARVVRECDCSVFEVLGASVEFLIDPRQGHEAPFAPAHRQEDVPNASPAARSVRSSNPTTE
jgi:hypothetical protein